MWLSNFCIRRPVFTIVLNVMLAIMGLWAARDLQIRQFPRLVLPSITVVTAFPGADPELVERQVTAQLEAAIGAASGIETMTSTSQEGLSTIQVNFLAGTDPAAAVNDVRAKVSASQSKLPAGIIAPVITQVSTDGQPVLYLAFADARQSDMAVTAFVQNEMVPRLTAIPGVAQAQLIGDRKYAIRLQLDPVRMAAYGVTVDDVRNALAQQNIETPGGEIRRKYDSISVLVDTSLSSLAEFNGMALRRGKDGYLVLLSDVGKAVVGPDQTLTGFRYGGKTAVAVGLVPQSTANPLDISAAANAMLPELRRAAPPGMVIDMAFDTSGPVKDSVDEVAITVFIAVGLVLLVIVAFIGSLRTSMIPMMTIPLSLFGTLMFIDLLDFSINIFSLLAMVLAVGLVVDDAIVEVENVQRHVDAGLTPMDATFLGSQEVGFAVIATTITLASVFAPMGFAGGTVGQIFREFAFTLAICILLSGFIARTLAPMLCGRLIYPHRKTGYTGWVMRMTDRSAALYRRAIIAVLGHRWLVVLATVAALAATVMIAPRVPASVSAGEDEAYVVLKFSGPPTASLGYLADWTARAEAIMTRQPEVESTLVMLGMPMQNEAMSIVSFKPWSRRSRTSTQITDSIMTDLKDLPGLESTIFASDPLAGVGAGQPVQWILKTSGSYTDLAAGAEAVIAATRHARSLQNVTVDLHINTPKVMVSVDRQAAADVGVPVSTIGATIQSLCGGQRASTFVYRGDIYNVIIELPEALAAKVATLEDVYVTGRTGDLIPLRSLVTITRAPGPAVLARTDQMNSATLGADPLPGHSVAEATAELKAIAEQVLPPGIRITGSAAMQAMEQSAIGMALVMLLAIVFIYLVLSAQFESFRDPAIILTIVPLAICGAIVGLYIFDGSYNLYSVIGFVALVGLIAKHGILIVEFTNQLRDQGYNLHDALIEASALRLRPIVMTTTATVLGALPLAFATGAGAGGRSEIGIVIAVGMTFGTLVSLFILPAVYSLMAARVRRPIVPLPGFLLSDAPVSSHAAD
nr:efflux RND transporter permease subunit [uncultured Rhodopila sp.]